MTLGGDEVALLDISARLFEPELLERALAWDMPAFLRAFTLHDSILEEFRHSPRGGIAVTIDWDLHWNSVIPQNYQKLSIVFPMPYSLTWTQGSWYFATLEGARSEPVPATERANMLSDGSIDVRAFQNKRDEIQPCAFDESLTRTEFQEIGWSRITILHNSDVRFLCYDEAGSLFPIPKFMAE